MLTRARKLLLGAVAVVAIAMPLALGMPSAIKGGTRQATAGNGQPPWFETASIKLNEDTGCCAFYTLSKDRFAAKQSAIDMIMFVYGEKSSLKPAQVLGGPDWIKTEVFKIDAELPKSLWDEVNPLSGAGPGPPPPPPPPYPPDFRQKADALKQVFRSLLINRFKLRIRHETKVLPVYELVSAKNGAKIAKDETADGSCRIGDVGPDLPSVSARGKGRWLDVKCEFDTFAEVLSSFPELSSRVLVDKTGLHGGYSFKLHWTPEMRHGTLAPMGSQRNQSAAPPKPSGPSLFTALREQLGLKVQSTTAPLDIIVVEHIEKPALAVRR